MILNKITQALGKELKLEPIDLETFYGLKFSLRQSKMSYTDYINDERFRVELLGCLINGKPGTIHNEDDIIAQLNSIDWPNTLLVTHNALFDGYILKEKYGITAGGYFCTMMGANVLWNKAPHDLDTIGVITQYPGPRKKALKNALKFAYNKHYEDLSEPDRIKYEEYCANDVATTYHAAQVIIECLPNTEIQGIDFYIRRFLNPALIVDTDLCETALAETQKELKEIVLNTQPLIPGNLNYAQLKDKFNKDRQFAEILQWKCNELGIEMPIKWSEKQNKEIPAISNKDDQFMNLVKYDSLRPLINARLAVKGSQTRDKLERFISTASKSRGLMPVASIHHSAHTGRPGASNKCNLMNPPRVIPGRPQTSDAIRHSLRAPKRYILIIADYSNIEPRLTNWFCEQEFMMAAFREGKDPYKVFASIALKKHYGDISKEERNAAKVQVLSLNYGSGWIKYQNTLALGAMGAAPRFITDEEAKHDVYTVYRPNNPGITKVWEINDEMISFMASTSSKNTSKKLKCIEFAHKYIQLPSGRVLDYSGLRYVPRKDKRGMGWVYGHGKQMFGLYGSKILENQMQALARDIHLPHLLQINKEIAPVVMDTYDEIVTCCPEYQADDVTKAMEEIMTTPPWWAPDLPLAVEIDRDYKYSK